MIAWMLVGGAFAGECTRNPVTEQALDLGAPPR